MAPGGPVPQAFQPPRPSSEDTRRLDQLAEPFPITLQAADWLADYRGFWEESFDRLGQHLREIQNTRVFDAPRELVWKAWTEPDRPARWWGKRSWRTPSTITVDVSPAAPSA